jgi:hypothetical protein
MYIVNASPLNLDSQQPFVVTSSDSTQIVEARSYTFNQTTVSTTWLIKHNLNALHPSVQCLNSVGDVTYPETVLITDASDVTVAFVPAQTGSCTVLSAGYLNLALNAPSNTIIGNPSGPQRINGPLAISGGISGSANGPAGTVTNLTGSGTGTGNYNHSGTETYAGAIDSCVVDNVFFVKTGCYATPTAALAACSAAGITGCTIDMSKDPGVLAIGSFDPGNVSVTLLLGPYTYTVHTITLRSGFSLVGSGKGPYSTILNADGTTADVFALGGTGPSGGVQISGFRLFCGSGNRSQIGFHIVAQTNGGGLWLSAFKNIEVTGCAGGDFLFDGNAGGSPGGINQFLYFEQIDAFRATNGLPAFRATGANGQFSFNDVEFDGPGDVAGDTSGKINFQIDDGTVTWEGGPYTFLIQNGTFQGAQGANGAGIKLMGVQNFTCLTCHFENDNGGVWAIRGNNFGNWGNTIQNSVFWNGTGIDSGNGFILKTDANSAIAFDDNDVYGTTDAYFSGVTTYVSSKGNVNNANGTMNLAPGNNRPVGGFDSDGPSLKHIRVSTGSITGGARANVAITWTTAFPDGNYSVVCNVVDAGNALTSAGFLLERQNINQTATGTSVTVLNNGSTGSGVVDCIAIHD